MVQAHPGAFSFAFGAFLVSKNGIGIAIFCFASARICRHADGEKVVYLAVDWLARTVRAALD